MNPIPLNQFYQRVRRDSTSSPQPPTSGLPDALVDSTTFDDWKDDHSHDIAAWAMLAIAAFIGFAAGIIVTLTWLHHVGIFVIKH